MKLISLSNSNKEAIVDDADFPTLSKFIWRLHDEGYAKRGGGNAGIYMHRQIMRFPNCKVDHRDRNGLNNQKANLRLASDSQNIWNTTPRHRLTARARSKFLGVSWDKLRSKWKAYVCSHYNTQWLGRFDSEIEAAQARDTKAIELHGEFAALNFPLGAFSKAVSRKI